MSKRPRSKGHGCLGFGLTLTAALIALFAVLFFTTNVFDGLKNTVYGFFYPQKYTAEVEEYSKEFGVEEATVYAVIKSESGFREDVESHAGAIGLMQLMPSTFEWLQDKLEDEIKYTAEDLKKPDINIRYGTYFLSYLLERYGDLDTACAAYNAGTTTVDEWLSDKRYSDDGIKLKVIPYPETESYVRKIADAREMYLKIYYSGTAQPATAAG